MRIALIIPGTLDRLTGGTIYDRFLVERLRGRGHGVEVIELAGRPYALGLIDNLDARRLEERLRGVDLVLEDGLGHPALLRFNRRRQRAGGPPRIALLHQVLSAQPRPAALKRLYALFERIFLHSVDAVLATSADTRAKAGRLAGGKKTIVVVEPGGDRLGFIPRAEEVLERSRRPGPLALLFVGGLAPIKGFGPLLDSLRGLGEVDWRLTVAGAAPEEGRRFIGRRLEPTAAAHVAGRVRFLGRVDGAPLREAYARSQVFAMPYACESFGIAALEAMAFGLPVIGSTSGGVSAFVRHGENGYLVAPADRSAPGRILAALDAERSRLAAMGAAALAAARARPGWSEAMDRAADFIESLCRENACGA